SSGATAPVDVNSAATLATTASAERFRRDRAEPGFRISSLESAKIGRCIDRTDSARSFDIGQLLARRMVDADDRDPVIGRYQAVAGVDELWRRRGLAMQQRRD